MVLAENGADRALAGLVFKGVPAILAMIGDAASPSVLEAVGYLGEFIVLRAVALGLGTCWVSGTYHPGEVAKSVPLNPGERIYAVSPVGYPARPGLADRLFHAAAGSARRKPLADLIQPAR